MTIKKIAAMTLGCKVNFYDTEAMLSLFVEKGYEVVDFQEYADVYIINTCTVTNLGDKKSRQMIRRAKKLNPNSIVAATGCYAQISPEEVKAVEGVNIVLGSKDRKQIFDLIENYSLEFGIIDITTDIMKEREFELLTANHFSDRQRAYVKIQDGCDRFCAYCIIPYARGPVRSKPLNKIIFEINEIAKKDYKEIVLTGIHLASYGKDLLENNLLDVLIHAHEIKGIERIRMSSLEPTIITEQFIETLKKLPKVCSHFHLSLQSGCDETLLRMNRKYTADIFRKSVSCIRNAFPDAAITTDMIVGFPGETEDEFKKSKAFAFEMKFMKIHVFPFSPKKGTVAASLTNQVSKHVKEKRAKELSEVSNELTSRFYEQHICQNLQVLFEEETQEGVFFGHTHNYIPVFAQCHTNVINEIIAVNITHFDDSGVFGVC